MDNKFFLHQVKHTNNVYDKGIVVKDTFYAAKQGYHAYLGAYAYGHDPTKKLTKSFTNQQLL